MPKITISPENLVPEMPEHLKEFYEEGKEAKLKGKRLWQCPHIGILPLEKAWMAGWSDKELEMVAGIDDEKV